MGGENVGSWRNWQTRKVEGLVPARACWFDSSRAHSNNKPGTRSNGLHVPGSVFLVRPIPGGWGRDPSGAKVNLYAAGGG